MKKIILTCLFITAISTTLAHSGGWDVHNCIVEQKKIHNGPECRPDLLYNRIECRIDDTYDLIIDCSSGSPEKRKVVSRHAKKK